MTKEEIKSHISFLKEKIKECKDSPDSASWGYQEGVLITKNDAKFYLKSLQKLSLLKSADQETERLKAELEAKYKEIEILKVKCDWQKSTIDMLKIRL